MFIPSMKQVGIAAAVLVITASSAFAATVSSNVALMSGPGDNYRVVTHLTAGASIKVLNEHNAVVPCFVHHLQGLGSVHGHPGLQGEDGAGGRCGADGAQGL